jgi:hypothetical protein
MHTQSALTVLIGEVREMAAKEAEEILLHAWQTLSAGQTPFGQLEGNLRERVLSLGGNILQQAMQVMNRGYVGSRIDCACGTKGRYISDRTKTLVTLLGEVGLKRAYYHCQSCGTGDVPLDKKWDMVNTGFSPAVREAISLAGVEVSFERAMILVGQLLGLKVSKQRVEKITEQYGQQIGQHYVEESQVLFDQQEAVLPSDQLYISTDGTMVNTYDGWKEAKVGAVFWARGEGPGNDPIRTDTKYLGSFETSEAFGHRLWSAASQCGIDQAKHLIVIGDGAKWIWNEASIHFPGAVQIVDWFHALEKLWDVSKEVYGEGSKKASHWMAKVQSILAEGNIEGVIRALRRLKSHCAKIQETISYFQNNKERMRYKYFRRKGYFIGSGVIESSCKHIVGQRLKRAGMRWSAQGADAVLQLRICRLNNQWQDFYRWHLAKVQGATTNLPTN